MRWSLNLDLSGSKKQNKTNEIVFQGWFDLSTALLYRRSALPTYKIKAWYHPYTFIEVLLSSLNLFKWLIYIPPITLEMLTRLKSKTFSYLYFTSNYILWKWWAIQIMMLFHYLWVMSFLQTLFFFIAGSLEAKNKTEKKMDGHKEARGHQLYNRSDRK